KHLAESIRARGIELIEGAGPARLHSPHDVELADGRIWRAGSIILAAGGHGRKLPIPGAELALTHSDIWSLHQLPARVAVVGAAATGCQLASIFQDFGCTVALLEFAQRITPTADEDISRALTHAFEQQGIAISTGAQVRRIERTNSGLALDIGR